MQTRLFKVKIVLGKKLRSSFSVLHLGIVKLFSVSAARIILLHETFLQFDWLRAVVFQLNLKYLPVKITNLLRVVV